MTANNTEALRAYFARVRPMCAELFNIAYAICGDYGRAEYCLQCTLTDGWLSENGGGVGFKEGLRNTLKHVALEEARAVRADPPELTWNGLAAETGDAVLDVVAQESVETRRMLALKNGCGLSNARIGKLMNVPQGEVAKALTRVESRVRRRTKQKDRRQAEVLLQRAVRREMQRASQDMPSVGAIYRAFESEAAEAQRPNRLPMQILSRALAVILVLICGVIFWATAVLLQPAQLGPMSAEDTQIEEFVQE